MDAGVIEGPLTDACMLLMNAAVPGEGGGKDPILLLISGVRPVLGVRPVRGVSPVRKLFGSKARVDWPVAPCCGPASIAGESGPERRELANEDEENHEYDGSAGELIDARGGRTGLGECSRSDLTVELRSGERDRL